MISVVVPTRNEEVNLRRLLESLENNNFDDYEVVVVDGGSEDSTVEVAEEFGARVLEGPRKGTGAARNVGWKNAEGDIIYFLDADWFLGHDCLESVAEAFDKGADVVSTQKHHHTDSWVSRAVSAEIKFGSKNGRIDLFNKIKSKLGGF